MLQLSPFLAAIDCPLKILGLMKPLIEIIAGLGKVPTKFPGPGLIGDFAKAAEKVAECFVALTPGGWILFVCDLLRLIQAILGCLIDTLENLLALTSGLTIQIQAATGNSDLLAQLECAKENAEIAAKGTMAAIEPITAILALAEPIFGIAQIPPIELKSPPGENTAAAVGPTIQVLKDVVATIDSIVESACP
jgi:hypothetical protein